MNIVDDILIQFKIDNFPLEHYKKQLKKKK